ncbi:MAG: hypothetical protein HY815_19900 [Candidatus Riflebacteria bacterium]|nr:hypothetical protein [Candidatus Riflebacteria bacterium]
MLGSSAPTLAPAIAAEVNLYALEGRVVREPQNLQVLLQLGQEYSRRFDEGRLQDDSRKGREYLDRAVKVAPQSVEAKARSAVLTCLDARERNSKNLARKGLSELDALLVVEPNNPLVRELRGFVGIEVPGEFVRVDQALSDLTFVEEQARKNPSIINTYALNMPKVFLKLGKCWRAKGDMANAKKWWQEAVQASPTSWEGKTAARLMRKHD